MESDWLMKVFILRILIMALSRLEFSCCLDRAWSAIWLMSGASLLWSA